MRVPQILRVSCVALLLGGCASLQGPAGSAPTAAVVAEPIDDHALGAVTVLVDAQAARRRVVVADDDVGLAFYDAAGRRTASHAIGAVEALDARGGFPLAGRSVQLLATADEKGRRLRFFEVDGDRLTERGELKLDAEPGLVCLQRATSAWYAFAVDGDGGVTQWQLYERKGRIAARPVRSFAVGAEVEACAADDASDALYLIESDTAIWRYRGDPEAEIARVPVAVRGPLGALESPQVLALTSSALFVVDRGAGALRVLDRAAPQAKSAVLPFERLGIGEAGALAVGNGWLAWIDEAAAEGGARLKLFDLAAVLNAAGLRAGASGTVAAALPAVTPSAETRPMANDGDAADDPAIWRHPGDPARSRVIGTNKQYGLLVYSLKGELLQSIPAGRINNVDLRDGFKLGGRTVTIVAGSNRSNDSIVLYAIDGGGTLRDVADGVQAAGLADPYGLCLYRSAAGQTYVFVNDSDGRYRQGELLATAKGRVRIEWRREFRFDSQPEGCVADDEAGVLYAGEEDVGLWRLSAAPDGGDAKTLIDHTGDGGHLVDDVEGMALWQGANGSGYLVVSSQGEDAYAVYERAAPNRYVGKFRIVADAASGIDGASETDGLDVSSASFGGEYAQGLLVVQDGRNVTPAEPQNFKLVPWSRVATALGLR
ncbi:MAG TPA: phytase [Fontimonas sp.]